jgi:hypothetical protein
LEAWIVEARRTCQMLTGCVHYPIDPDTRAALLAQRTRENEALTDYIGARQMVFDVIQVGLSKV